MNSLMSLTVFLLWNLSVASSQPVTGFIGGEVLLPCVYSGKLSKQVNAFWRDKNDNVVLDIVNGKEDKIVQSPKFKDRVFSFKDQYETGNLSILIKGLRADDAGPYECDIPKVEHQTKMTLKLTEKPAVKITTPRPLPPVTALPRGAAVTSSLHHLTLLCPALFVLFFS
ncbi:CD276 antigen homolog isoform X2 [Pelmatolapia mariae]|uniref:CD276 antigen homolog isoform X2 n=1 Tax=Pelmatolapia mariae TaxID=158779 RepID=UPI002FE50C57